jgi:hypothetical protein
MFGVPTSIKKLMMLLKVPVTEATDSLESFSMVFTKADNGMFFKLWMG